VFLVHVTLIATFAAHFATLVIFLMSYTSIEGTEKAIGRYYTMHIIFTFPSPDHIYT